MNKLCVLFFALQLIVALPAMAQFNPQLVEKAVHIQNLATAGYENQDSKKLLKAAKILRDNPRIRSLRKHRNFNSNQPDYFNEKTLLKSAFLFTPIDKKGKRRKIQKKIDAVSDHVKMGINDGDLMVEMIKDLDSGDAINIPLMVGAQKLVQLHLEGAQQLTMSLFHAEETNALISDAEKRLINLKYQTKSSGNYKIEVKNQSYEQTLGTILMIMY